MDYGKHKILKLLAKNLSRREKLTVLLVNDYTSCTTLLHSHWAVYCDDKHHQDMRPQLAKNGASKAKSPCTSLRSFQTESDIKKLSICTLLYLLEQAVFSGFIFRRAYFWLEKCEQEARSCTCHSPRTILATASIFDMLVLYQLLLKCTKCQYVEQTVSLLFLV